MFDFGIFCHPLRLMGIYRVGPVLVFEKFRSLFSFLPFLFFLVFCLFFFSILHLFVSLGGPFSSGAPGHCPSMPPSRYATGGLAIPARNILRPVQRNERSTYRPTSPTTNNFSPIQASKDCYKQSFLPRTVIDWNQLYKSGQTAV